MVDMSKYIVAKSDQLNADDLLGGPRVVTVTRVREAEGDQPVAVHFEGDNNKPFKPCKSMRRVMVHCWGREAANYAGRSMELFCDPDVMFGGMKVGGIRISKMSHIDAAKSMALQEKKGRKGLYKVEPLRVERSQTQERDFSNELEALRTLARPGNMTALQDKWQSIGADARKHLAAELPALKAACDAQPEASDDVPFDAEPTPPQQERTGYDGV